MGLKQEQLNEWIGNFSSEVRKLNPHLCPPPRSLPERVVCDEPVGETPGEDCHAKGCVVRIVSHRRRLLDPDNLAGKFFVDSLRYGKLIKGDSAKDIVYHISQEKVGTKEEEHTEIVIEYE